jgi:hypothetical protein
MSYHIRTKQENPNVTIAIAQYIKSQNVHPRPNKKLTRNFQKCAEQQKKASIFSKEVLFFFFKIWQPITVFNPNLQSLNK